ncbi:fused MFS/spermidine synthase [Herbiconiux sp. CPCC 205716]|uniref:Fused MFS/spermidine synthase n=1 Tax=Herbiconiux gentiana TaxID=2970912 RepID=A0ABT2GGW4_9MICO|nr:fused MFS/spermidine synthase [Herbiconiux gentiana]MCS5715449.1 fused MFS/spermidine synthase [Herbiconiux gentiana]
MADDVVARTRLRETGEEAVIRRDPLMEGAFELVIGGSPQSHVDLGDPASLFHDYVRRIGAVVDRLRMPGEPITAVHLGAGALTLPRYVQATRPDSEQHVIELAEGLVPFVTEVLPLPRGTRLAVHPGDAARVLHGSERVTRAADLVIADLYQGTSTPPHLRTPGFYRAASELLAPEGVLVVNVADDDGAPALRAHLEALAPVFPHLVLSGPTSVVTEARAGNGVVLASASPALLEWLPALRAAGPHPGAVHPVGA